MNKLWRIFATALSFTTFGLMGLFFALFVSPLILLFYRNPCRRKHVARSVIQKSFYAFLCWMRFLRILDWQGENLQTLNRPGQLILLIAHIPNASAIVKASLKQNPFTYAPVHAAGYCCNDEGPALIQECVQELHSGSNLVIFPEGTRTLPGHTPHLKRGAMLIALTADVHPTIVKISCEPLSLTKDTPWWRIPDRPMFFKIKVCGLLDLDPYRAQFKNDPPKATRAVSQTVYRELFNKP